MAHRGLGTPVAVRLHIRYATTRVVFLLGLILSSLIASTSAVAAIAYVQGAASGTPTSQSTVSATYSAAQGAGDLNVVLVSTGAPYPGVQSLTDTIGNVYSLAVGPTTLDGFAAHAIYYAKNIAAASAGSNTVTLVLNGSTAHLDIRIAEYSGIDTTNPFDVGVGATGFSTAASTGLFATSYANDLLVAGNWVESSTISPGSYYTQRLINGWGQILEDRIVTTASNYDATATLSGTESAWVMQVAAFRAAGVADTQPPTVPTGLTATAISSTQINLSWAASTDNIGVTGYVVERCQGVGCSSFAQIAFPTTTTYNNTGRTASTSYSYRVRAQDAAGNYSGYSNTASATTPGGGGGDTQAPTTPTGLAATAVSSTQIDLSWNASTDNVAVTGYLVERCSGTGCVNFAQIATPTTTTYNDTGRAAATNYSYRVRARDAVPNYSGYSSTASAVTPAAGDTQAPSIPTNLSATAVSSTQINLSWTASTDNVGVTGYLVERCAGAGCSSFSQIATPTSTSYNDTGRTPSTSYSYRVRAQDAVPNYSGYSATASATTQAAGDTQAPTTPTGLTATAGANQIALSWTASTDNVAVTAYLIERCQGAGCSSFAQIDTAGGTTYTDTMAVAGVSYSYRVRARDAVPNYSGYSNTVTAIPADCD